MLDPLAQQVGVGGAVAVVLVATVMKFLPAFMTAVRTQSSSNGRKRSGDLDPADWEQRFGKIIEEKLKAGVSARNEQIRVIIREELAAIRSTPPANHPR